MTEQFCYWRNENCSGPWVHSDGFKSQAWAVWEQNVWLISHEKMDVEEEYFLRCVSPEGCPVTFWVSVTRTCWRWFKLYPCVLLSPSCSSFDSCILQNTSSGNRDWAMLSPLCGHFASLQMILRYFPFFVLCDSLAGVLLKVSPIRSDSKARCSKRTLLFSGETVSISHCAFYH